MKKKVLLAISGLFIIGCTTQEDFVLFNQTSITQAKATKKVVKLESEHYEYRIRPHDRISMVMYNYPEFGTTSQKSQQVDKGVLVNSKGNVRLPLIRSIHVSGLTETVAQKKIEKAYKKYLDDAELTIEVINKRAHILGEVKNSGFIALPNEKMTLLQVIAEAGDFTDSANKHAIVIMKRRYNKMYTETLDLTGTNSIKYANKMIYPNDVIYVTPNDEKSMNVGIQEVTPAFGLAGKVLSPLANLRYLFL